MQPVMTRSAEAWLQPAIHPVYARLLAAELANRGFDEAAIFAGTRLDAATLATDNRFLSFEQFRRFVAHAVALSDCPWLGLEVGSRAQLSLHGAVGQAVSASPDVATAMALVQRYMPLRQRLVGLRLEADGDELLMIADEYLMTDDVRECLLGYLTATLLRLLEAVTGLGIHQDLRIEWPFAEPPWAAQYRRLAAHNRFGATRLCARLPRSLLARRSLAVDLDALRIAERECERQLAQAQKGGTLSQRVQQRLAGCRGNYPALDTLAGELHMSPRTLIRRLAAEGTRYQQLLDNVREELACWQLVHTPDSIEAIALALGYDSASNFSRTFRRWTGTTPGAFRARAGRQQRRFRPAPPAASRDSATPGS